LEHRAKRNAKPFIESYERLAQFSDDRSHGALL
jgi:hypothetical protein